jgi:2-keto-4-pentenoate hydratase/2-oxohepta-3-ene-1,7-dioic acid hydratase in catechol pathway
LFFKTLQSFVGHDQPVVRPKQSVEFDYEAELAVVISKPGRYIPKSAWREHVAGFTCLLDGSIRDYQKRSVDVGKNFYHASSIGPWLATLDEVPEPENTRITCRLNGETMQDSTIDQLVFDVGDLVSYYSEFFALEAGDVISTGTPSGVGFTRQPPVWMKDGDVWEMEITGVGLLRNSVVDA